MAILFPTLRPSNQLLLLRFGAREADGANKPPGQGCSVVLGLLSRNGYLGDRSEAGASRAHGKWSLARKPDSPRPHMYRCACSNRHGSAGQATSEPHEVLRGSCWRHSKLVGFQGRQSGHRVKDPRNVQFQKSHWKITPKKEIMLRKMFTLVREGKPEAIQLPNRR